MGALPIIRLVYWKQRSIQYLQHYPSPTSNLNLGQEVQDTSQMMVIQSTLSIERVFPSYVINRKGNMKHNEVASVVDHVPSRMNLACAKNIVTFVQLIYPHLSQTPGDSSSCAMFNADEKHRKCSNDSGLTYYNQEGDGYCHRRSSRTTKIPLARITKIWFRQWRKIQTMSARNEQSLMTKA